MNGYSKDLRMRVLSAVDGGLPRREAANLFGVSLSTLKRYLKRRRDGEDLLAPRPSPGRTPIILATAEEKRDLWAQLSANDDATLERHCELWVERRGTRVSVATMSRAVRKLGWTYKKSRWWPPSGTRTSGRLGASA